MMYPWHNPPHPLHPPAVNLSALKGYLTVGGLQFFVEDLHVDASRIQGHFQVTDQTWLHFQQMSAAATGTSYKQDLTFKGTGVTLQFYGCFLTRCSFLDPLPSELEFEFCFDYWEFGVDNAASRRGLRTKKLARVLKSC